MTTADLTALKVALADLSEDDFLDVVQFALNREHDNIGRSGVDAWRLDTIDGPILIQISDDDSEV